MESEESLQLLYLFIKLLAGYEVRRADLTRRALAVGGLLLWRVPVNSVSDNGRAPLEALHRFGCFMLFPSFLL